MNIEKFEKLWKTFTNANIPKELSASLIDEQREIEMKGLLFMVINFLEFATGKDI